MKHCLAFASLISPSKMILFEKKYQTFDTVFHHQMKHLEVRQKHSAARRIFNSVLDISCNISNKCSVSLKHREESLSIFEKSSGDETLCRMFDISSQTKSFLKEKLRMQILSSVSSDFQTLIKH